MNFRPEYHAAWMQKSWYQQLPLLALGAEATAELLRDLLGSDPALAPLAALVRERTGGNPFFIEEVVQSLVDQGVLVREGPTPLLTRSVPEIQIPSTVQAVLAARIDRLAEREKRVLQTAAVVGKTFTESLLQRVLEADAGAPLPAAEVAAALRALTQAGFLYEQAIYPETEYAFKHPLTQEVAYGAQLAARRAGVHAAVARALVTGTPRATPRRPRAGTGGQPSGQGATIPRRRCATGGARASSSTPSRARARRWAKARRCGARSWSTPTGPAFRRTRSRRCSRRPGSSPRRVGDVHTLAFVAIAAGRYRTYSGAPLEAVPLLEEGIAPDDAAPCAQWQCVPGRSSKRNHAETQRRRPCGLGRSGAFARAPHLDS